jgi:hypothetical protein
MLQTRNGVVVEELLRLLFHEWSLVVGQQQTEISLWTTSRLSEPITMNMTVGAFNSMLPMWKAMGSVRMAGVGRLAVWCLLTKSGRVEPDCTRNHQLAPWSLSCNSNLCVRTKHACSTVVPASSKRGEKTERPRMRRHGFT